MQVLQRFVVPTIMFAALAAPSAASAQQPPRQQQLPDVPVARGDVQRLFDAYTLMQAQDALRLTDSQYDQFVPRMRNLQETRRRNLQARARILGELARASALRRTADENTLRDRLKALREQDAKASAELQQAYEALDEVLDLRQQARFRVFEENMERKKFDLLMRARQRRTGPGGMRPQSAIP